ncbi:hypothetical protein HYW17_04755 [Candidatus Uhrbacteria bacterium]|nr:hypothetical protein [Candidatus Uhrbacteria bacterium]
MTEKQWMRVRGPIFLMMLGGLIWGIIKIQLGPHREIFRSFLWETMVVLALVFALLNVPLTLLAWHEAKRRTARQI